MRYSIKCEKCGRPGDIEKRTTTTNNYQQPTATLKNEQRQPTTTNNQQERPRHTKRHVLLVAVELEHY